MWEMTQTANNEPVVELDHVNYEYTTKTSVVQAIKDIDLTINQGDFFCLVGPSGCGKSTLLKTIAGYIEPTSGESRMENEVIKGPHWKRGVVFQSATLYPWLTVRKNIEYGPRMRKQSKEEIKDISDYYLDQIELSDFANHYPYELSGGMKQRVSLARVLANKPKLVLMDEPFSALDAITRLKMQDFLRVLWKKNNQTILLITHDIEEALLLGTKVAVMSKNPGTIQSVFSVPYSEKVLNDKNYRIEEDSEFMKQKYAILKAIS